MEYKIFLCILLGLITTHTCSCQDAFNLGIKKYQSKDYDAAYSLFSESIEKNVKVDSSYLYKGIINVKLKKADEALIQLEKAFEHDSQNSLTCLYLAKSNLFNNNIDQALKYVNHSIRIDSNNALSYDCRAIIKAYKSDLNGALVDENRAIELDSLKPKYYLNRGFIQLKLKGYDQAIFDFDRTINLDSLSHPKAYSNSALAYYHTARYDQAIVYYNIAIDMMPEMADLRYLRGLAYKKFGDSDNACVDFKSALDMGYAKAFEEYNSTCR